MASSHHSQKSLDAFLHPGASGMVSNLQPGPTFTTRPHSPTKRPREDSGSENGAESEADISAMDFQPTANVTATQALGDETEFPDYATAELSPPLSTEHAAIRSDFEIITLAAMERFYIRITADIAKSAADASIAFKKSNDQLHSQVATMGARISQLQQQVLTCQGLIQRLSETPVVPPTSSKKDQKKKKDKQAAGQVNATAHGNANPSYAAVAAAAPTPPVQTPNTAATGWTTLKIGGQKDKKVATVKLIPTTYPQTEREVTCHFAREEGPDAIQVEQDYTTRQIAADTALCRVNTAIVNNKDVFAPAFIHARVTVRGNIIFTTGNTQNNVVYEDYTTIIADALSYYGKCTEVEIGKRFSQFLLHGVPTHLSLPEISLSITSNYPQLIQSQTPRWLTPADRRESKANSTIVMTLAGNIKKAQVGRQHLIVCNRQCELDDYIAYGRNTQCRKCQAYGHPAALCRNNPHCAVCAEPHETREHPCALPICKKGPACTHPPIRCVNCDAPHKASDPNCPERIKIREITKTNTNATTMGDAPEAGVAH